MTMYRYRLASLRASSAQFGRCEVCRKHVSEVFLQTEEMRYTPSSDNIERVLEDPRFYTGSDKLGWTQAGCHSLFGHKECLLERRKAHA